MENRTKNSQISGDLGTDGYFNQTKDPFLNTDIFHLFFNLSRDLMCIASMDGYFQIVNPSFVNVLGYTQEELTTRPFASFIHPEDVDKTAKEVEMMFKEGKSTIKFENRYLTKIGKIIHLEWNTTIDLSTRTIYAIARDISEKHEIESRLQRSEHLMNEAQSIAKTGSWSLDLISGELYWSEEMYKIYHIDQSFVGEELKQKFYATFQNQEQEHLNNLFQKAIEENIPYTAERLVKFPNGDERWIRGTGVPVTDQQGKVIRIEGIAQDIHESKLAQEKLERSEKLMSAAQSIAKLGSWSFDLTTSEVFWSDEFYNIFAIDKNIKPDLRESFLSRLSENDQLIVRKQIENSIKTGKSSTFECPITLPDQKVKWIFGVSIPEKNEANSVIKVEGIIQDITERKLSEQIILNNVQEKEILLKELHHRVKNNMQVISSLLSLQSSMIKDESIKSIFMESQQRIKSMASIHDMLYRSSDLSEINFSDYIITLINDLLYSYKGPNHSIELNISIPTIYFHLDIAVPLGLFVNEVVTNSLKHGFKGDTKGILTFTIDKFDSVGYKLNICDNGPGFSDGFEQNKESLGIMLIENLASQLDGFLECHSDHNGTCYNLTF